MGAGADADVVLLPEDTWQRLLAVLPELVRLTAGSLNFLAQQMHIHVSAIESQFALVACGLVLYGMVMVAVMRRELGFYAVGR